jgi:hypothetical protein
MEGNGAFRYINHKSNHVERMTTVPCFVKFLDNLRLSCYQSMIIRRILNMDVMNLFYSIIIYHLLLLVPFHFKQFWYSLLLYGFLVFCFRCAILVKTAYFYETSNDLHKSLCIQRIQCWGMLYSKYYYPYCLIRILKLVYILTVAR